MRHVHHDTERPSAASLARVRPHRHPCRQLRVLEPTDIEHVAALFDRMGPRSLRLRFFTAMPRVPRATVRYLADIDHQRHEAVGIFEAGALVGAAHYFRSADDPTRAEISAEVADTHQGQGLGTRLLAELARQARRAGIDRFALTVLQENEAALAVLNRTGWPMVSRMDGPELTIDLAVP
jgi:GNAT superfamily N-acetyltransferase